MSDIINHALLLLIYFFSQRRRQWIWNTPCTEDLHRQRRRYGRKLRETYGIFCNQFDAINFVLFGRESAVTGNMWEPLMSFHLFVEGESATEMRSFLRHWRFVSYITIRERIASKNQKEIVVILIFVYSSIDFLYMTLTSRSNDRFFFRIFLISESTICNHESNAVMTIDESVKSSCQRDNCFWI